MTGTKVATALGLLAVGTCCGLARQAGAGALDTLYAEDGQIFLSQALRNSPAEAFSTPYGGYFHAVPRLVAEVVAAAPLERAATLFAGLSALVVAAVGLLVYRASAAHVRSRVIRGLLAASVVLVPVGQRDVFNTAANLHWFLMFGCVWLLLWRPDTVWGLAGGSVILFLTALSDPITVVLVPLAVARLVVLKGARDRFFTVACLAGLAVQFLAMLLSDAHREGLSPTFNPLELGALYGYWVVAGALVGLRFLADPRARSSQALAATAVLAAGAIAAAAVRARRRLSPVVPLLLVMSVAFYLAAVVPTGGSPQRYAVAPALLLLSAVGCGVDHVLGGGRAAWERSAGVGVLLILALVWGANYRVPNERSRGPRWSTGLADARAMCRAEHLPAEVTVGIAPPGWRITLPCAAAGPS